MDDDTRSSREVASRWMAATGVGEVETVLHFVKGRGRSRATPICTLRRMLPPEADLDARRPLWEALQMFWMDTDPELFLDGAARVCAESKFTLDEIEAIYWNEVRPAVKFNLSGFDPAPEWAGFRSDWLEKRTLDTHRFGKRLPVKRRHVEDDRWWRRLETTIVALRHERAI
jgi:hypothetical protein